MEARSTPAPMQARAPVPARAPGAPPKTSGSSSGTAGTSSSSSGGSGCVHRSDCPNALACLSGTCGAPQPDAGCASDEQCVKAFLCEAGKCEPGCNGNVDCHGTNLPKCILGNPGHCSGCTANSDCQLAGDPSTSNEVCQGGRCIQPASCTSSSTCGDLGCVNGFCSSCHSNADCALGVTTVTPSSATRERASAWPAGGASPTARAIRRWPAAAIRP